MPNLRGRIVWMDGDVQITKDPVKRRMLPRADTVVRQLPKKRRKRRKKDQ